MSGTELAIVISILVYFGAVFGFAILSAKLAENWPISNLDPEQAASQRLRKNCSAKKPTNLKAKQVTRLSG